MPKAEVKTYDFCGGGSCCPVLIQHADKSVDIVDEGKLVLKLRPEDASRLVQVLTGLGYGSQGPLPSL